MAVGARLRDLDDPDADLLITDVIDLVEHAPQSSALFRKLYPEDSAWSLTDHLLASMFDYERNKTWVQGNKRGPRPKQIQRPGVVKKDTEVKTVSQPSTMSEMAEWLASRRASKK